MKQAPQKLEIAMIAITAFIIFAPMGFMIAKKILENL